MQGSVCELEDDVRLMEGEGNVSAQRVVTWEDGDTALHS